MDREVAQLVVRTFRFIEEVDVSGTDWLPPLIGLINDKTLSLDSRTEVSEVLKTIGWREPATLQSHINVILGVLAQACIELDEFRSTRPKDDHLASVDAFFEYQGKVAQIDLIVGEIRETVVEMYQVDPDTVIDSIKNLLGTLDSTTAGSFKAPSSKPWAGLVSGLRLRLPRLCLLSIPPYWIRCRHTFERPQRRRTGTSPIGTGTCYQMTFF